MPFNAELPEWNKTATAPDQTKKDNGWTFDEKPPASMFNWFFNTVFLALQELQNEALNKDQLIDDTETADSTKPATANAVKVVNDNTNAKYTKPTGGIPKTDLTTTIQASLGKADTALQTTQDGILNIPTQPYLTMSTGIDKAISNGVDTKITLDTEANDVYGEFTAGVWKPKETGVYMISVIVKWLANVNGVTTFKLFNGGAASLNMDLGHNTKVAAFARPVKVTAGTPFDIYINQDSGANQTMDSMYVYITKLS